MGSTLLGYAENTCDIFGNIPPLPDDELPLDSDEEGEDEDEESQIEDGPATA
jgi:hypothetical protein